MGIVHVSIFCQSLGTQKSEVATRHSKQEPTSIKHTLYLNGNKKGSAQHARMQCQIKTEK